MTVVINGAYLPQRVSGQQRYAREIAARLEHDPDVRVFAPTHWWSRSALRTWAWVQVVLPGRARTSTVLSMTARAPLVCASQVLVVHDLFVIDHPEWFSRRYVWTHAPLLRAQLRSARALVAVSQPVADQLAEIRDEKVLVAPNAPSDVFLAHDTEPATSLTTRDIEPGSYFLAVGNKDPRKNLAGLARAYGMLSDRERAEHPLLLVGGEAGIFRDTEIEWPDGAAHVGYVEDDELRRLYRDAGAVVFVSLAEGFGLPLVEAVAAGARKLVISDLPVFRWICEDGAWYVDPHDADSIARGLVAATHDEVPDASIDLGRFTWGGSAEVVADVCRRAALGSTRQSSEGRTSVTTVPRQGSKPPKVAVVLASAGRPELLGAILATCKLLSGVEFDLVVSVPDQASLPADASLLDGVQLVVGTRGLAAQRNAGLEALKDVDIVAFFDDDSVVRPDYLTNAVRFLEEHPGVVGLTGRVLLDGAVRGEVSVTDAAGALAESAEERASGSWTPTRELYGCNFVVRMDAAPGLRFDDRLPLYSWLEDHDFARRLMPYGALAHVDDCVIVHRGAASGGRQSHLRLGYSQVMNPAYLHQKGSFPLWLAAQQIFRPVAKNLLFAVARHPDRPWRRERLMGNLKATVDLVRGRTTPEKIVEL